MSKTIRLMIFRWELIVNSSTNTVKPRRRVMRRHSTFLAGPTPAVVWNLPQTMLKQSNGGEKLLTNSMPLVASLWDPVTKRERAFRVTKSRPPSGLEKLPN